MKNTNTNCPCEVCKGKMPTAKNAALQIPVEKNILLRVCSWCAKGILMSDAIEQGAQA